MKALPWILAGVGISTFVYFLTNQRSPSYATGSSDVDYAANKTSTWGTKQRLTGTGGSLIGKAKQGFGEAIGDDDLAADGMVDQVAGTVKDAAGKAAHAVSDTIKDLNR